ncbi:MAG: hypothetical protein M3O70_26670, partial [Actinomycetota bacterium]|nr:hypothetical protein [Actinomycetota bacterium]
ATDQWLRHHLSTHGLADAADDPEWRSLVTRVRQVALAGYDVSTLMDAAIHLRPIDDAHSTAAVIHWRLGVLTDDTTPVRTRGPLASLPPTEGPAIEVARQTGELIRQRWRDLRTALAGTTQALPRAEALGPRPIEPDEASTWLTAATAVTAYRERYGLPDHTDMLGERPPVSRPDARAAWDHARLQTDRYLSRRLRDLDDVELTQLDERMQSIIVAPPVFDPLELEEARRRLDAARRGERIPQSAARRNERHARRCVEALERAARLHAAWQLRAEAASDTRRRIALERRRRSTPRQVLRRAS